MSNKHTPGPWKIAKEIQVQAGDITFEQRHIFGKTYEELDANARLIAAAPELLSQIERLVWVIEHLDPKVHSTRVVEEYNKSKALIIKAKRAQ